ncbi:hypothetical protein BT67DRAFT_79866 [Trichocladium antarcticum]|uniref:Uncharacterized protein n=1 Tax=Trichocladium antarcticum TaxID=1450529 RepID=A0AAN6UGC4_9PEZI|nr:hypothetical protein BT67DRAFT_79866 [Trichocladium antarcticum]
MGATGVGMDGECGWWHGARGQVLRRCGICVWIYIVAGWKGRGGGSWSRPQHVCLSVPLSGLEAGGCCCCHDIDFEACVQPGCGRGVGEVVAELGVWMGTRFVLHAVADRFTVGCCICSVGQRDDEFWRSQTAVHGVSTDLQRPVDQLGP